MPCAREDNLPKNVASRQLIQTKKTTLQLKGGFFV